MTSSKSSVKKELGSQWPNWLSIALFTIIAVGLWIFNQAYLTPLFLGFIFAALSYPIYGWLVSIIPFKRLKEGFAAGVTMVVLSASLIGLVNLMTRELIKEIPKFGNSLIEFLDNVPNNTTVVNFAGNFGLHQDDVRVIVDQIKVDASSSAFFLGNGSSQDGFSQIFSQENITRALDVSRQAFGYIFNQLIYLVIFVLAWFNGLVNGKTWLDNLLELTPLDNKETDNIKLELKHGIQNVIYANLLSGAINVVIVVIIMLIFGLPNIFIVAIAMFLIGVLPLTPSELGYAIPILMLFQTNPIAALILIPVCELILLYINYVFLPSIIAGGEEGNPLLIITSILSGIAIFGIMGFVIAPVLMILLQTLYKILVNRIRIQKGDLLPEDLDAELKLATEKVKV